MSSTVGWVIRGVILGAVGGLVPMVGKSIKDWPGPGLRTIRQRLIPRVLHCTGTSCRMGPVRMASRAALAR